MQDLVKQTARRFYANGERPSEIEIARTAQGSGIDAINEMTDAAFGRFVRNVSREYDAMVQDPVIVPAYGLGLNVVDQHRDCTADRHTPRCVAETEWRAAEENEMRALWGDK
jgi:hypothetical protein